MAGWNLIKSYAKNLTQKSFDRFGIYAMGVGGIFIKIYAKNPIYLDMAWSLCDVTSGIFDQISILI